MTVPDNQKLLPEIRDSLRRNDLELPPIPYVAADLLRLTSVADPSFSDIGACVGRDP